MASAAATQLAGSIDRAMVEQIVRQVALDYLRKGQNGKAPVLTVQTSSRHMHICREDMDTLFGPGTELTFDRPLFQEGNFAAKETVTIVGPRNRLISNLRILGPMRKQSQVELAFTDAIMLGFNEIPIRLSGDIAGTPGAIIIGPKGVVELKEGVIRAAIHVHMNPTEAAHFGVSKGDRMKLRIGGASGLTFNNVHVRIDPTSRLNVHMDTDEANACGLHLTKEIELLK
ncbi:MAG TPA: phosphate propanoyltransferase [Terracidiphilus sp.]|jgi:putative phosphotransacetylase|nr:phosphate propanoyltransferase [Terracidiphilus sp.]